MNINDPIDWGDFKTMLSDSYPDMRQTQIKAIVGLVKQFLFPSDKGIKITKKQWKITFLVEDMPRYNFHKHQPMGLHNEEEMEDVINDIQRLIENGFSFKVVDSDVKEVKE